MNQQRHVRSLSDEIELLSRLHITYGLMNSPCFVEQKQKITDLINSSGVNVKRDLDPISLNLYRRYFR